MKTIDNLIDEANALIARDRRFYALYFRSDTAEAIDALKAHPDYRASDDRCDAVIALVR